ncbi:MAG: MaoC/PaaZ C-terminal domain-containing protein [Gemmobacter sp.]
MAAFDPDRLRAWAFALQSQTYDARDAIIYALGVGLPLTPGDSPDLGYLLEDGLKVLPSFAVTLASPGMWVRDPALGIDWVKILHMAQAATFHATLPPGARITSQPRIKSLHDRGAGKGAVCVLERDITDAETGTRYCTVDQTILLRGNDGFGGPAAPAAERVTMPDRAPDAVVRVTTSGRAALIYRLSGDLNPLHADYAVARRAGFDRPILHGLASYGTAAAVVLRAFGGDDPARMTSLALRFSGVVYPGDTLRFDLWQDGGCVLFEAHAGERKVLDQGVAGVV